MPICRGQKDLGLQQAVWWDRRGCASTALSSTSLYPVPLRPCQDAELPITSENLDSGAQRQCSTMARVPGRTSVEEGCLGCPQLQSLHLSSSPEGQPPQQGPWGLSHPPFSSKDQVSFQLLCQNSAEVSLQGRSCARWDQSLLLGWPLPDRGLE